jgi:hypothetical protein
MHWDETKPFEKPQQNPEGEELYVWSGNVRYNSGQDRMAGLSRFRNCEETLVLTCGQAM